MVLGGGDEERLDWKYSCCSLKPYWCTSVCCCGERIKGSERSVGCRGEEGVD